MASFIRCATATAARPAAGNSPYILGLVRTKYTGARFTSTMRGGAGGDGPAQILSGSGGEELLRKLNKEEVGSTYCSVLPAVVCAASSNIHHAHEVHAGRRARTLSRTIALHRQASELLQSTATPCEHPRTCHETNGVYCKFTLHGGIPSAVYWWKY